MENNVLLDNHIMVEECSGHLSSVEDAIYVIGGKWKLKIIIVLQESGNIRFNELQRKISGISREFFLMSLKILN
jgi:DNA-binding HxlR family transcriptional regulator